MDYKKLIEKVLAIIPEHELVSILKVSRQTIWAWRTGRAIPATKHFVVLSEIIASKKS